MEDFDPKFTPDESKPQESSRKDLNHSSAEQFNILEAERKRYLEMVRSVGRAPAFVIEFKPSSNNRFSKEDIFKALQIGDAIMGEDKGAVIQYHREANSYNVTGVFLNETALKRFIDLVDSGKINADVAISTPEAGDEQNITVSRNGRVFTTYGSSILALTRGEKEKVSSSGKISVYELSTRDEKTVIADKQTQLKKVNLSEAQFDWPTQEELEAANLPEFLFRKRCPARIDDIEVVSIDTNQMLILKPDINDSGRKIIEQVLGDDPKKIQKKRENRALIVAANFHLLNAIQETVEIFNSTKGDKKLDISRKAWILSILGDSAQIALVRPEYDTENKEFRVLDSYINVVSGFADQDIPDDFGFNHTAREDQYGHLTNVVLPIDGIVNLYIVNGEPVGFDKTWSGETELLLEEYHKKNKLLSSEMVSIQDLN